PGGRAKVFREVQQLTSEPRSLQASTPLLSYNRPMSLAPALLLSMPQLVDPNFARTVILLCEHSEEGAFGLVVNRPAETSAADAVQMEPAIDDPNDLPLLLGGPVEPQRGWILTAAPVEEQESRPLGAGLYLSASPLVLRE